MVFRKPAYLAVPLLLLLGHLCYLLISIQVLQILGVEEEIQVMMCLIKTNNIHQPNPIPQDRPESKQ